MIIFEFPFRATGVNPREDHWGERETNLPRVAVLGPGLPSTARENRVFHARTSRGLQSLSPHPFLIKVTSFLSTDLPSNGGVMCMPYSVIIVGRCGLRIRRSPYVGRADGPHLVVRHET